MNMSILAKMARCTTVQKHQLRIQDRINQGLTVPSILVDLSTQSKDTSSAQPNTASSSIRPSHRFPETQSLQPLPPCHIQDLVPRQTFIDNPYHQTPPTSDPCICRHPLPSISASPISRQQVPQTSRLRYFSSVSFCSFFIFTPLQLCEHSSRSELHFSITSSRIYEVLHQQASMETRTAHVMRDNLLNRQRHSRIDNVCNHKQDPHQMPNQSVFLVLLQRQRDSGPPPACLRRHQANSTTKSAPAIHPSFLRLSCKRRHK